jgi:hypothetical protein
VSPDIIPAKAEVVFAIWIDSQPQKFSLDTRASKTTIIIFAKPASAVSPGIF